MLINVLAMNRQKKNKTLFKTISLKHEQQQKLALAIDKKVPVQMPLFVTIELLSDWMIIIVAIRNQLFAIKRGTKPYISMNLKKRMRYFMPMWRINAPHQAKPHVSKWLTNNFKPMPANAILWISEHIRDPSHRFRSRN